MVEVVKGSKTVLEDSRYTVGVRTNAEPDLVDVAAVLLGHDGKVRSDDDFVFFNNPHGPGVDLTASGAIEIDLNRLPADVERVLVTGSTEAQGRKFGDVTGLVIDVQGQKQVFTFTPEGLDSETVLQMVAFYRRGTQWRLDAVGQGYSAGLAAFATEHGIDVGEGPAPTPPPTPAVSFEKVKVALTKDSPTRTASIDLRKSRGERNWVLTVGLEWDGRGAIYDRDGNVKRYGTGDLDVYFFCRNEETNDYVVISGERGHRGNIKKWPFIRHFGDSKGPGRGNKPATEQVEVKPHENGDLLVNIYQSVDNGAGALDTFGKPRVAIRYGRAGSDGLPGPDADEIVVYVGNSKNSYWATVAHIDVQDGVLTVDGEIRYSRLSSERMPGLDTAGNWVRTPRGGPTGRSKKRNGTGLDHYSGRCPQPS